MPSPFLVASSPASLRVDDDTVIVGTVDEVSGTGHEREVRASVGRRLGSRSGDGAGAVDGGEDRRLRCLLDRVGGDLADGEADLTAALGAVDDHGVSEVHVAQAGEERRAPAHVVDVAGDGGGADVTGDAP